MTVFGVNRCGFGALTAGFSPDLFKNSLVPSDFHLSVTVVVCCLSVRWCFVRRLNRQLLRFFSSSNGLEGALARFWIQDLAELSEEADPLAPLHCLKPSVCLHGDVLFDFSRGHCRCFPEYVVVEAEFVGQNPNKCLF